MKDHIAQNKPLLITVALLAVAIAIAVAVLLLQSDEPSESSKVEISGTLVEVEVADTPRARTTGLSEHKSLGENEGMWFEFESNGQYRFHMKDMDFSIDIIWLDENKEVVDITADISPQTFPDTFTAKKPFRYVLEVNAGFAEVKGIEIGDNATLISR